MSAHELPDYTLLKELKGARGSVNALLFSDDGKLLLSGDDDDCVRVWNTSSLKVESTIQDNQLAQVTVLTWVYIDTPIDDKWTMVAIGSARGYIVLCPMSKGRSSFSVKDAKRFTVFSFNDAVEAMVYDRINSKLAVSSHGGQVKLYAVDKTTIQIIWTATMSNAIPRALFFYGARSSHLLILGLETGEICCRDLENAKILWSKTLDGGIGGAALSYDQGTLIVDNLSGKRFDVHAIPSTSLMASLRVSTAPHYTKQCTFSEGARVAVCGSAINKVYILDVTTNETIQVLTVGTENTEMIQTVAATKGNRKGALIAGGSNRGNIYLWKRIDAERQDETSSALPGAVSQSQATRQGANDILNAQIVFLVFLLTYPNWWPHLMQLITAAVAALRAVLQNIQTLQ